MPERVPVVLDLTVGDPEEDLRGRPGMLRLYKTLLPDGSFVRDADVCCPGCGQAVAHLSAGRYPLLGDDYSLSCVAPIFFGVCCQWAGWLRDGEWIEEREP